MTNTIRRTRPHAVKMLMEAHAKGEVLTGVFYLDTQKPDFTALLHMTDEALATLPKSACVPDREVLEPGDGKPAIAIRRQEPGMSLLWKTLDESPFTFL